MWPTRFLRGQLPILQVINSKKSQIFGLDNFADIWYNDVAKFPDLFCNMRELFYIFVALILVSPAFAESEGQQALDKSTVAAAASYVEGAYNALDTAKQDKLTTTNVVTSGSGAMVTGVSASNGTVTVTKGEVTIPVGATVSNTRATIWLE